MSDLGMAGDFLFVYGTLRSSFTNPHARLLAQQATLRGPARVRGRLYDLGEFPGMRVATAGEEWVRGELHELRDEVILAELDRYEGPEFLRQECIAITDGGFEVRAWVYGYTGELSEDQRIVSGDYLKSAIGGQ